MLIEIVSHCYAAQHKHYASALHYQLSSLYKYIESHDDRVELKATICCSFSDEMTDLVLQNWLGKPPEYFGFGVKTLCMSPEQLGRRAIGRNMAAKDSKADIVWFSDVDQVFANDIFHRLADMPWPEEDGKPASMIFPREIQIHRDHKTGDEVLEQGRSRLSTVVQIDPKLFIPKKYHRAIGGVQIVKGNFARQHGYLDGHRKWQKPRTDGKVLGDFHDDRAYRGFCVRHGPIVPVDLQGLFRLRHSTCSYR